MPQKGHPKAPKGQGGRTKLDFRACTAETVCGLVGALSAIAKVAIRARHVGRKATLIVPAPTATGPTIVGVGKSRGLARIILARLRVELPWLVSVIDCSALVVPKSSVATKVKALIESEMVVPFASRTEALAGPENEELARPGRAIRPD